MNPLLRCPPCGLSHSQRNGHTHYGKPNHQGLNSGRQFVTDSQRIPEADRPMIKGWRRERLSRLGICPVMGISRRGLLSFVAEVDEALPDDLNLGLPPSLTSQVKLRRRQAEADERGSFVGRKLRQRVSGLVRARRSFSKSLSNHLGASKYFICDYNQMLAPCITFS